MQDHDEQQNAHDPQTSSQPIRYVAGRGRGGPPAHYQQRLPLNAMAMRLAPDPPSNGELGASGAAVSDGMVVDEPELAPDPPSNGEVGAAGPVRSRLRDRVMALFVNDTTYLTVAAAASWPWPWTVHAALRCAHMHLDGRPTSTAVQRCVVLELAQNRPICTH